MELAVNCYAVDEGISEYRSVRDDFADTAIIFVHRREHRRRSRAGEYGVVCTVSPGGAGVSQGTGNPCDHCRERVGLMPENGTNASCSDQAEEVGKMLRALIRQLAGQVDDSALFPTPYSLLPIAWGGAPDASRSHRQRPLLDEPLHRACGEHGAPGRCRAAHGADPDLERRGGMEVGGAVAPGPIPALRPNTANIPSAAVSDFLIRDIDNPSSSMSSIETARVQRPHGAHRADARDLGKHQRGLDVAEAHARRADRRARSAEGAGRDQARDRADPRLVLRHACCATRSSTSRRSAPSSSAPTTPPASSTSNITCCCRRSPGSARRSTITSGNRSCARSLRTAPTAGSTTPNTGRPTSPTI